MKINSKEFENSYAGLRSARKEVEHYKVIVPFADSEKASEFANFCWKNISSGTYTQVLD